MQCLNITRRILCGTIKLGPSLSRVVTVNASGPTPPRHPTDHPSTTHLLVNPLVLEALLACDESKVRTCHEEHDRSRFYLGGTSMPLLCPDHLECITTGRPHLCEDTLLLSLHALVGCETTYSLRGLICDQPGSSYSRLLFNWTCWQRGKNGSGV